MTVLTVVAVRDRAADVYSRPFFVPTVGMAVRSFMDEINRASEDNQLYRHPEDYDLFQLGEFDDETGKFRNLESPKQLAVGNQLKMKG